MLKRVWILPIFPFLLAIFPILALLGHNIRQVSPSEALRPLVVVLGSTLIVLLIARLVLRNWVKAALVTSLFVLIFMLYGSSYHQLKDIPVIGVSIARHRYLLPVSLLFLAAGTSLIAWKVKKATQVVPVLNLISLLMLFYPTFQISSSLLRTSIASDKQVTSLGTDASVALTKSDDMPDIYYIILDMHTRSDALLADYGYDNSAFIDDLENMGFYVAKCSRSNYTSTYASLITTLNMEYLDVVMEEMGSQQAYDERVLVRLRQNTVRYQLESLGYRTYAFESEYEWSRFTDAYAYLGYEREPVDLQRLRPFEVVLIKNSMLLLWSDAIYANMPAYETTHFHGVNNSLEDHVNRQFYILDQLPELAEIADQKFVFAHMIVPHVPFVFMPDGSLVTDPAYYSGDLYEPEDREHLVTGYLNQVGFIDTQIVEVVRQIIARSEQPPVIILQGDHGFENDNRLAILYAVYLPNVGSQSLYSTVTPVNTYRVIFNTYFGAGYELLPDISYSSSFELSPETYPECQELGTTQSGQD